MFAFASWQGTAGSQNLELTATNRVSIATNCRFPEVGTPFQLVQWYRLELMVPSVGTKSCHGKELPVPSLEIQRLPLQNIVGSQRLELFFSKLSGYHCKELQVPKA